ncbi:UNVERIFIED_CONTAM: hypothetical protein FKN15_014862 [Acipenser sinensis]
MDPGLKLKENDLLMTENPGNPLNQMTTAICPFRCAGCADSAGGEKERERTSWENGKEKKSLPEKDTERERGNNWADPDECIGQGADRICPFRCADSAGGEKERERTSWENGKEKKSPPEKDTERERGNNWADPDECIGQGADRGQRTAVRADLLHMVAASVGTPGDPRMDFKELIRRFNKNTAAYKEQTRKMERQIQELGLAQLIIQEREPTELERLLQRWELPSREPEGVELPSREPEGVELPSREPEGVELLLPEPRGEEPPLPEPSSMQASPVLPREVPSPVIVDTSLGNTAVRADLLHMVAASVGTPGDPRMDFKELISVFNKNTAAYKEQTRKMERQIQELGLAPLIIQEREPTELERLLQRWELPSREPEGVELPSREPERVELLLPEPRGEEPPHPEPSSMQASPALPREVPSPVIVDTWPEGPTHPQARPWKRAKIDICGLEGTG